MKPTRNQPPPEEGRRLRLGCIDYINVLPVVHCLDHVLNGTAGTFDLTRGSPEELNGLMADGRLDLGPVSSIEYARHQDRYLLVRDLCIASRGTVRSVVLFSRVPLERLTGETVAICQATATSRTLLRVLLERFAGVRPLYREHGTAEDVEQGRVPAVLLIGDDALAYRMRLQQSSTHPARVHVHDLGGLWWEATGLPMVFAVWAVRREVERWSGCAHLADALTCSREMGVRLPLSLLAEAGKRTGMARADLEAYYHDLEFRLDDEAARGLLLFYRHASELGLCPPCTTLESMTVQAGEAEATVEDGERPPACLGDMSVSKGS